MLKIVYQSRRIILYVSFWYKIIHKNKFSHNRYEECENKFL